jgi:hypothetical protein
MCEKLGYAVGVQMSKGIPLYVCNSVFAWTTKVKSNSSGKYYTIAYGEDQLPQRRHTTEYSCTCMAYRFKGECKHIESVDGLRCTWNEDVFVDASIDAVSLGKVKTCPKCNGPVRRVMLTEDGVVVAMKTQNDTEKLFPVVDWEGL